MLRLVLLISALWTAAAAAAPLTADQVRAIDAGVSEWMARANAPSLSIAVVVGGELTYVHAYGQARLSPPTPATPETRYDIGSISKQFTAAAILELQQEGKLSLDDHVSKYFPELTDADQITLRQLLSHTSGYRDFWPEDFLIPALRQAVTPQQIIERWATKPLDFAPGAEWQYSNTNYVIAGAIVEKVSGELLAAYIGRTIFAPLAMTGVVDDDHGLVGATEARGYTRFASGPPREADKEGAGWTFGAGEFAMTAQTLAKWDISLMNRSLLSPASYDALYAPAKLKDGAETSYSLGLVVQKEQGRLVLSHDGGRSGFHAENWIWPAEKVAIVALGNGDWVDGGAVDRIAYVLLPWPPAEVRVAGVVADLQQGRFDRSLFTDIGAAYFTPQARADLKESLAPYGAVRAVDQSGERRRGGQVQRTWRLRMQHGVLIAIEQVAGDGRLDELIIEPGS
jgi:CubicO group peptidase (beta-lactamase class C family)